MISEAPSNARLEPRLALLLGYGTWLGCAVIVMGIAFSAFGTESGTRLLSTGVGLFIALPILRVVQMLVHFARTREMRFMAICAAVLTIIFSGIVISLRLGT